MVTLNPSTWFCFSHQYNSVAILQFRNNCLLVPDVIGFVDEVRILGWQPKRIDDAHKITHLADIMNLCVRHYPQVDQIINSPLAIEDYQLDVEINDQPITTLAELLDATGQQIY